MPIMKRNVSNKIPYKMIALALSFLVLIFSSIMLYSTALANEKIYNGVSVGGINVGGMTREEARATIYENVEIALGDKNIDIFHGDKRQAIDIIDRVNFDYSTVVDNAYNIGRNGNFLKRIPFILGSKIDIPHITQFDDKYIKSKINSFAQEIESLDSAIKFSDDMNSVKVDLTGNGIIANVDATYEKFAQNGSKMLFEDISLIIQKEFNESSTDLIYNRIKRDPVNATSQIINNRPVIKEHELGIIVDKRDIAENIAKGKKVFSVEVTAISPEITTDKLKSSMFSDVLGEYSTNYNATNKGRTRNIIIATEKINNVVIAAGENFSFNRIVGERSYERGYMDANVYVGGRIEQGVGGGICQVVSTLYSAQLLADLKTVTRHNHQFTVSYLPLGQDATVAWGAIDYVFNNNTDYPIKLVATANDGRNTIKILGTKADKNQTVKISTTTISASSPIEKVVYSTEVQPGKSVVTQNGQNGAVVDTYKVYSRNGIEEKRVFLHRSTYSAMERIVTKSSVPLPTETPDLPDNVIIDEMPTESTNPTIDPIASEKPDPTPTPSKLPDEYTSDNGL